MKRAADIVVERIEQLKTEREGVLVVALDGPSGVGKTTIAKQVAERIDAVNVFCDDFFVGGYNQFWGDSTPENGIRCSVQLPRTGLLVPYTITIAVHPGRLDCWDQETSLAAPRLAKRR